MSSLFFYIVDVFAEAKYTGNQLAVFTNTASLYSEQMQQIAKEINYSETTFVTSTETVSEGYDVRIFTPKQELPFAGHPTLGTAYILQKEIIQSSVKKILLNLEVGQIPVTIDDTNAAGEYLWMQQKAPTFHQILDSQTIAEVLRIQSQEIDSRFPIQAVSTGVPFIIVPLKTLESVKRIQVNKEKYFELINSMDAKSILVFCPETYKPENDLNVRVFCDYIGIPEDPATGSANGCLAGYLVQYSYFGKPEINLRVEQGYEINRPSLILLRAEQKGTTIDVNVGGKVVMVARGEFL
ncbi:MAG: PhzF family phenazine biosynthesis protein [Pelatocladus maniniholoensis HA4357-MV3]|jgi:trans-2,3-dihydro-3-hydroxyanthranilate isomerase|uniref:PhzF family phenazine biosynthesis protein n=1 Tax=Pelatocladus maniniholoensis HA4357-MV3 TaxID=1117104 RepID=A0A9E3H9V1_9NOST|nr:PhzF family phenazine biosynthesis protein [Pelatocladus maniniholoensis HA4357-MV3]BAZ65284.1 PhzF family phenazine biosynthesis protein [Fischerella sp. NIES-4106]